MTNEFHHVTVLLHETVDMLDIKPDGIYVDATLGGAGHSSYLLSQLSEKGHLYCFDQDQKAIDNAHILGTIHLWGMCALPQQRSNCQRK